MSNSNKALVIEVLQTVFVERDTSIVSTHFSNNYIQHNPLIANGSESIPPLVAALPAEFRDQMGGSGGR